jgi:Putative enzyme of poly-gamma-glutamate biosynthesis (capsule formation)
VAVVILNLRSEAFIQNEAMERAREEAPVETFSPETTEPVSDVESTPEPTPTPEPEPEEFILSFIGDNSLWANENFVANDYGLPRTVGDDYAYPYKNTVQYFKESEYTLANLECTLSDQTMYSDQQFSFLTPTKYVNILTEGDVDFVTMANNHTMDFYEKGLADTKATLEAAGIPYGTENDSQIVTTPNGIKLGIYTGYNTYHPEEKLDTIKSKISEMRQQGADLIICMFHWGQELYYTPNENQIKVAHECIDAGADIIYGSHPHCLQPVEEYNGKEALQIRRRDTILK